MSTAREIEVQKEMAPRRGRRSFAVSSANAPELTAERISPRIHVDCITWFSSDLGNIRRKASRLMVSFSFSFGTTPIGTPPFCTVSIASMRQLSEQDHSSIGGCQLLVSVADLSLRRLADVVLPPHLPSVGHVFALVILFDRLRGRRRIASLIPFFNHVVLTLRNKIAAEDHEAIVIHRGDEQQALKAFFLDSPSAKRKDRRQCEAR